MRSPLLRKKQLLIINLQADNIIEPGDSQSEKNEIPEKHKDNETPGSAVIETSKEKPAKKTDSAIMADRFSHLSNRFNEQLGGHNADDESYRNS